MVAEPMYARLAAAWYLKSFAWQAFVAGVAAGRGEPVSEEWLPEFSDWWDRFAVEVATAQLADELQVGGDVQEQETEVQDD